MNVRSRNRSVVATHSLSLDMRLRLDLWPRPQFWRCHRQKPRPPLRPPRPRRRPQTRRSLGQSAVRSGVADELNGARNAAPDAQSGGKSGAQDATNDETRATAPQPQLPPSKRSSRFIRATTATGPPQRGPGKAAQRAASAGLQDTCKPRQRAMALMRRSPGPCPSRLGISSAELCTGIYCSSGSRHKCGHIHRAALILQAVFPSRIPCAVVLRLMPRSLRRRIRLASATAGLPTDRSGWTDFVTDCLAPATGVETTRFCRTR